MKSRENSFELVLGALYSCDRRHVKITRVLVVAAYKSQRTV